MLNFMLEQMGSSYWVVLFEISSGPALLSVLPALG